MPNRNLLAASVRRRTTPSADEVDFTVDGVRLYELLGLDEGAWVRPPLRVICPPSDHLLGGPDRWEDPEDPWFDDHRVAVAGL